MGKRPKYTSPKKHIIKLSKIKDKERILKAAREKKACNLQGNLHNAICGFLSRDLRDIPVESGVIYSKCWKRNLPTNNTLLLGKVSVRKDKEQRKSSLLGSPYKKSWKEFFRLKRKDTDYSHENVQHTGKGKHTVKFRIFWYCDASVSITYNFSVKVKIQKY